MECSPAWWSWTRWACWRGGELGRLAAQFAAGAGDGHAFAGAHPQQVDLELGEGGQDVEEHRAHGVGGVVEGLLRAAREQGRTPAFTQAYPTRSNVERTVAHVATQNRRRIRLRHLGVQTNNTWLRARAAALNLRTMLKHGLTRADGAWALA
jgi:hypothetical protein